MVVVVVVVMLAAAVVAAVVAAARWSLGARLRLRLALPLREAAAPRRLMAALMP